MVEKKNEQLTGFRSDLTQFELGQRLRHKQRETDSVMLGKKTQGGGC